MKKLCASLLIAIVLSACGKGPDPDKSFTETGKGLKIISVLKAGATVSNAEVWAAARAGRAELDAK